MSARSSRSGARRRAMTIVEVLVAIIMLGVIMASVGKLAATVSQRTRINSTNATRNFMLAQQANYLGALPYDSLARLATTTDTITAAGGVKYTRKITYTVSGKRTTVKVVVTPISGTYGTAYADSVTFDRASPATSSPLCAGC